MLRISQLKNFNRVFAKAMSLQSLVESCAENPAIAIAIKNTYLKTERYKELSKKITDDIVERDQKDATNMMEGINWAVDNGYLDSPCDDTPITVDVTELTIPEVMNAVQAAIQTSPFTLSIAGRSGTGKTTIAGLLSEKLDNTLLWTNGSIFRLLSFKAILQKALYEPETFSSGINEEFITRERTEKWMKCLVFRIHDSKPCVFLKVMKEEYNALEKAAPDLYRVCPKLSSVRGVCKPLLANTTWKLLTRFCMVSTSGYWLNSIVNTVLRDKTVESLCPILARVSQGLVIGFTNSCIKQINENKINVILEGRAETLAYLPATVRIILINNCYSLIGDRRVFQRMISLQKAGIECEDELSKEGQAFLTELMGDNYTEEDKLFALQLDASFKQL